MSRATGHSRGAHRETSKPGSAEEGRRPLTHLSDHVAIATALDHDLDGTALYLVIALYRAFSLLDRDQVAELRQLGLTPIQFNILTTLQRLGRPTTIGALGSMLIVRPNHMSTNIKALVERGYVDRAINQHDTRSFVIELTPGGLNLLDKHLPGHWRRLENLMSGLGQEERMQLINLLRKMISPLLAEDLAQRSRSRGRAGSDDGLEA